MKWKVSKYVMPETENLITAQPFPALVNDKVPLAAAPLPAPLRQEGALDEARPLITPPGDVPLPAFV
jgi:hypothetical protein